MLQNLVVTSYILDQHLQLFYMPPKRLARRFEAGEDIVSLRKKEQIGGITGIIKSDFFFWLW